MKAVILAGGKGERMGDLTKKIPKPMLLVGGRPILEHQMSLLKRYGVKEILLLTGYLSGSVEEHFGDGRRFGVEITYLREEKPLGTTGGVKEIEDLLDSDFLVLYGDVLMDMNLGRLLSFHREKKSAGTLVLHPNDHPYDSDLVEMDGDCRITSFLPKPHPEGLFYRNLVNAGAYVLSPRILSHIKKGEKADFGRDLFPRIVEKEKLYGYNTPEYLKDMGTPERLRKVDGDFLSGKIGRLNLENQRKAIFLDRDGVINQEVNLLCRIEEFRLLPKAAEAIRMINDSEYLAVVVTNQPVVARNLCSIRDLENIHKKMETLLGKEGAKLDAIYYCPHHPDKGYPEENPEYKVDCGCRKPKTGMIDKATKDLNISLAGSFIIGDSIRDISCGKKAGLTTVAVGNDPSLRDPAAKPDLHAEDLYSAVKLIIGPNKER